MDRDESEIRQLVAAWMSATKAGDLDTVLSLISDDVVFLLPGQRSMSGKAAFAAAPPMTRAGFTLSVLKKENGRWVLARDANMLSPVES